MGAGSPGLIGVDGWGAGKSSSLASLGVPLLNELVQHFINAGELRVLFDRGIDLFLGKPQFLAQCDHIFIKAVALGRKLVDRFLQFFDTDSLIGLLCHGFEPRWLHPTPRTLGPR